MGLRLMISTALYIVPTFASILGYIVTLSRR